MSPSFSAFKTFLLLGIFLGLGWGRAPLDHFDGRFTAPTPALTRTDSVDTVEIVYHGKPLVMSLVVPGLGQWYNQEPRWRSGLFAGIELFGLYSIWNWNHKAEDIRIGYENYADAHWSLQAFIENTPVLGTLYPDVRFGGTHHLTLELNGILIPQDTLSQLGYVEGLEVLRDRDFYENIGKYDQFVGGWDDVYDQNGAAIYWEQHKDVGDSTEILIMTTHRNSYLNQRARSNEYLKLANFAVSAVMFNHVFSAFDALWRSNQKSQKKRIQPTMGLIYDRNSKYGIGGLALAVRW
ncbi:MAG: hypothetical protein D6762_02275 [Candidatus Neomarinimicrobiota bacterium]|nr:MAG: hypothetical protein D6762_02275 [Candidatus Neomarinimicrobiota bacterium]